MKRENWTGLRKSGFFILPSLPSFFQSKSLFLYTCWDSIKSEYKKSDRSIGAQRSGGISEKKAELWSVKCWKREEWQSTGTERKRFDDNEQSKEKKGVKGSERSERGTANHRVKHYFIISIFHINPPVWVTSSVAVCPLFVTLACRYASISILVTVSHQRSCTFVYSWGAPLSCFYSIFHQSLACLSLTHRTRPTCGRCVCWESFPSAFGLTQVKRLKTQL